MPHVTCAFSTFGVQNIIPNGCWSVTVKEAERMEGPQKTEQHLKFSAQYGCYDELMRLLIYLAFKLQLCFYGDLDYEQPLFYLVQCSVTHQKTQRKKTSPENFFYCGTLKRLSERGNIPDLMAFLYFVARKRFVGRRRLDSPFQLCFMNQRMKTKETEKTTTTTTTTIN